MKSLKLFSVSVLFVTLFLAGCLPLSVHAATTIVLPAQDAAKLHTGLDQLSALLTKLSVTIAQTNEKPANAQIIDTHLDGIKGTLVTISSGLNNTIVEGESAASNIAVLPAQQTQNATQNVAQTPPVNEQNIVIAQDAAKGATQENQEKQMASAWYSGKNIISWIVGALVAILIGLSMWAIWKNPKEEKETASLTPQEQKQS